MKPLLGSALLLLFGVQPASADLLTELSSTGSLSGWTTYGSVATTNAAVTLTLGSTLYTLTPAAGTYMASITTSGSTVTKSNIDPVLGLTSGTIDSILANNSGGDQATNFGVLTETVAFTPGTYTFYWAYAAKDYQPYNDGVLFSLAGNGTNTVSVLASNGPTGAQPATQVLGSYGSTQWTLYSFTIATAGTYQISFADYNWIDQSVDPLFFVSSTAGTVSEGMTDIDTATSSYLASALGTTLNPVFTGGTLVANVATVTSNFTVDASGGTIQSSGSTASVFSGVISDASSTSGSIAITSDGAGGSIVFTGANTYTGSTSIASGATLQLSGSGSLASLAIGIDAGGTLLDTNGGLSSAATVTADGLFSLGADESISSLSGSGSVALGSTTLSVGSGSFSGVISGTGNLLTSGPGTLALSGANTYTGSTSVAPDATLQLSGSGSLASLTIGIDAGGTLLDSNGGLSSAATVTADGLFSLGADQAITSLSGAGSVDLGANSLSIGSGSFSGIISGSGNLWASGPGTLALSGANTFTGSTTVANAATLQLSGSGSLASTAIGIDAGGTLLDSNGGLSSATAVTADGLFSLGADESLAGLSGSGSVALGSSTLSVGSGTFSGVISGTGNLLTSGPGTLALSGTNTYIGSTSVASGATLQLSGSGSLASLAIGIDAGGTLADTNGGLGSAATVTADGLFSLGANESIVGLSGSGSVALGANTLTAGSGTFGGVISGSGSLFVSGQGALTLTGTNTFTGTTTVNQGQLILNGSLAGNVNVGTGGLLGGCGVIRGSLTASGGIVSPGNSPGILTVGGNYTEAGTLRIEIDGTAGAGVNPGGHDQIAVGGTATLQSGSTLQLTRTNTFEPTWGQRFRVIDATGGISGTFSTLDRSAFSTQLFFDYGTGQVYGTGLAAGAPIGQFAGTSANHGAVLGAVLHDALTADSTGQLSFLDSRTAGGSFLKSLFDSSAPLTVLDVLSPVAYAGTADYALQVTRNFSRNIHYVPTLASANGWTLSAGYTGYRNGISKAAADDTNTDLRSNAAVVDVGRKLGERLTIGGFFAADDGAIRARRFSSDVTGQAVGLHLSWQPWTERRISLEGGASYGSYDFDNRRATTLGTATSKTDADVYDLWGRAKAGVYHTDRLGLSAFTGIAYTHATVSHFGERGVGDALAVSRIKDELVIGDIGAELSLALGSRVQLVGEAAYEHNFQDPRREVFARFTDSATLFRVTAHGFDEDAVRGGLRVEYALSDRTKLSAHYSAAISSSSEASQTFGGKLQYRF